MRKLPIIKDLSDKLIIPGGIAMLSVAVGLFIASRKPIETVLVGAPNLSHVSHEIPTRGNIDSLYFNESRIDSTVTNPDGTLTFYGDFKYHIVPQRDFIPKENHTDRYGRTPENSDYWRATREGSVTVSKR